MDGRYVAGSSGRLGNEPLTDTVVRCVVECGMASAVDSSLTITLKLFDNVMFARIHTLLILLVFNVIN